MSTKKSWEHGTYCSSNFLKALSHAVRYNVHRYESNTNLCCIGIINVLFSLSLSEHITVRIRNSNSLSGSTGIEWISIIFFQYGGQFFSRAGREQLPWLKSEQACIKSWMELRRRGHGKGRESSHPNRDQVFTFRGAKTTFSTSVPTII